MGVVMLADRVAPAECCQCYGRWGEAKEMLKATPMLMKPSLATWPTIANKQMDLMGRYMAELGLTRASLSGGAAYAGETTEPITRCKIVVVYKGEDGLTYERPVDGKGPAVIQIPDREPDSTRIGSKKVTEQGTWVDEGRPGQIPNTYCHLKAW